MGTQEVDILHLAVAAHQRGMDTPERVVMHLERVIFRNSAYIRRRTQRNIDTSFDLQVAEDNGALAAAIVLLESGAGMGHEGLRRYTERVVHYTALQIASGYGGADTTSIVDDILSGEREAQLE